MTYYIDTAGHDENPGTIGSPFLTLSHACDIALNVGDIIHVNAGTYTEITQSVLAKGVSIEGVGVSSYFLSHVPNTNDGENDGMIRLASPSQNTAGNQSISYLTLDGDALTGGGAIFMKYRSGVSVHHCTIVDFNYSGVVFEGENSWNSQPVAFSSGNSIHDNIITNCHGGAGGGNVRFTGQSNFSMYNNTIDGRSRSMQNSITLSNNKATTIYGNTFYTLNNRGSSFNFSFEIWDTWGGLEIRNNTFIGGGTIDLGGHYTYKGAYAFGASIHNNTFTLASQQVYNASEVIAITVESWATLQDVHIYNNHIKNFGTGIQVTFGMNPGGTAKNFFIYNNIFDSIGYSDTEGGSSAIGIVDQGVAVASWDNINIIHNVMTAGGANSYKAIRYYVMGANTNIAIKNNIISGFTVGAISFSDSGGSMNTIGITNNILYNNGATITGTSGFTNYTNSSNPTGNPLFVSGSDFHLQAGSPAKWTGVSTSITTDYEGGAYASPPSIGAYEYGASANIPVTSVVISATGGVNAISVNKGTLQMIATILPSNATDKTVIWSVVGSGATIDQNGLLTASSNGTVTVKATSNG